MSGPDRKLARNSFTFTGFRVLRPLPAPVICHRNKFYPPTVPPPPFPIDASSPSPTGGGYLEGTLLRKSIRVQETGRAEDGGRTIIGETKSNPRDHNGTAAPRRRHGGDRPSAALRQCSEARGPSAEAGLPASSNRPARQRRCDWRRGEYQGTRAKALASKKWNQEREGAKTNREVREQRAAT